MFKSVADVVAVILSLFHLLTGVIAVGTGFVATIQAEVWMAYSVGPVWTGSVFVITGLTGFLAMRRRTLYLILCLLALSITGIILATISIQLLRLGLVNQTTDGNSYAKEKKDTLLLIALGDSALEIFICLLTIGVALKIAVAVRKEMKKRHEGTFYVQVVGEKEILVVNNMQSLDTAHQQQQTSGTGAAGPNTGGGSAKTGGGR